MNDVYKNLSICGKNEMTEVYRISGAFRENFDCRIGTSTTFQMLYDAMQERHKIKEHAAKFIFFITDTQFVVTSDNDPKKFPSTFIGIHSNSKIIDHCPERRIFLML